MVLWLLQVSVYCNNMNECIGCWFTNGNSFCNAHNTTTSGSLGK